MKKILEFLGVDKAIMYVVMARGWGVISGLITLMLISKFISLEEQGYYYTFASILALQVIFELGLGTVLAQFVSHEMQFITINGGRIEGNDNNVQRIESIIRLATKWYSVMALLVAIVIIPLGLYFFSYAHTNDKTNVSWQFPWICLVITSSLSLLITPFLSIAEGLGFVTAVAKVRFRQIALSSVFTWIALFSGHGLYASASSAAALFIVGVYWIWTNIYPMIKQSFALHGSKNGCCHAVSWSKEILPMQWRIAVSWLCGYFIFQLLNPIAFKYYGPEFAGKLGMSINVVNLMLNLALAWISTKTPRFGLLVSKGKFNELDDFFSDAFKRSFIFLFSLTTLSCVFLFVLNEFDVSLVRRFLPPSYYFILCMTVLGNHIVACQATYIRSHKVELHLLNAILTATLMLIVFLFIHGQQRQYMLFSYLFVIWFFCVPHSTYLFLRFKKRCLING